MGNAKKDRDSLKLGFLTHKRLGLALEYEIKLG